LSRNFGSPREIQSLRTPVTQIVRETAPLGAAEEETAAAEAAPDRTEGTKGQTILEIRTTEETSESEIPTTQSGPENLR
jgi:hypothetical protein